MNLPIVASIVQRASAHVAEAGSLVERAAAVVGHVVRRELYSLSYRLDRLAFRIDPDTSPCPSCSEPGGAHYDCDNPHCGRMTRTERCAAFGGVES